MYGFSVFLNEPISETTLIQIEKMHQNNFQGIFTSIHIPEDDDSKYLERLQKLGWFAKERRMDLMVDISGSALQRLGFSFEDVSPLRGMGLTGIRMDYGVPMETIARVSRTMHVALNASTITEENLQELQKYEADFSKMEAWHNYYPRPETGLGKEDFCRQNSWLKEAGFTVMAFVAGDGKKRGPLFEGLPTLEKHRDTHPLAAALELRHDCLVDKIYIGDPDITEETLRRFSAYEKEQMLLLQAYRFSSSPSAARTAGRHMNRFDAARDVIRSADARFRTFLPIPPESILEREKGSITIDNDRYGRYAGEIQITKRDLPLDEKVNVAGRIRQEDLPLLDFIQAGTPFLIEWLEGEGQWT